MEGTDKKEKTEKFDSVTLRVLHASVVKKEGIDKYLLLNFSLTPP